MRVAAATQTGRILSKDLSSKDVFTCDLIIYQLDINLRCNVKTRISYQNCTGRFHARLDADFLKGINGKGKRESGYSG